IVSGQVNLAVVHREACEDAGPECSARSALYIDPDAHHDVAGTPLYDVPGNFSGTVVLDTTALANGRHALVLSTWENNAVGVNVGLRRVFVDVVTWRGTAGALSPRPPPARGPRRTRRAALASRRPQSGGRGCRRPCAAARRARARARPPPRRTSA